VHHEGGAGKAALPLPRRAIDWSQDRGRKSPDSRGAATTVESVPRRETNVLRVPASGSNLWTVSIGTAVVAAEASTWPSSRSLCAILVWLEAVEGPANASIQNNSGLPQGLAGRPATGWGAEDERTGSRPG
jgi:hypothetical protein